VIITSRGAASYAVLVGEAYLNERESLKRLAGEPPPKGGILAALRRLPLVGTELDLTRPVIPGRDVSL
jgi:hypothetical protein